MGLRLAAIFSLAAAPAAGDISLGFPVLCTLGDDCHIQQFVDHDPTSSTRDFRCGGQTYDGHKGTDIALPNLADMAAGVTVVAATDGVVLGARNDMADVNQSAQNAPDVAGRECGNGVTLDHGNGWQTQYCHLKRGSVTVRTGQTVAAGRSLGLIGLSGQTTFPHLHLSLRQNGQVVDPFAATGAETCTTTDDSSLWDSPLPAPPGGLIQAGFSDGVPSYDAIKAGTATLQTIQPRRPMVLWGHAFGTTQDDQMEITISGPDGEILREEITFDRTQAQLFRAVGRKAPEGGWPRGRYEGTVKLMRNGGMLDIQSVNISID